MFQMLSLAAILSLAQGVAEVSADVDVRPLGSNRYELTIIITGTHEPSVGHQAALEIAQQVCGALQPSLGHHKFEGRAPATASQATDKPPTLRFIQQIECLAADVDPKDAVAELPPAPDQPPTADEEVGIHAATLEYLAAKDDGDFDRAHAMLKPATGDMFTEASWREPRRQFNKSAGKPEEREVVRITWYDDPAGAPSPGRYAAADYRAAYASGAFYCGYVVWLRQHDGSYRIVREEEGRMDPETLARGLEEELPDLRQRLGCRD